ncbi:glycosyl transferase, partial [Streptomyces sp. TRM76130]|nr:glycosyl transferase [Streptomyces sp. TRM76130]
VLHHTHVAMRTWAVLATVISLAPCAVWLTTDRRARGAVRAPVPAAPAAPAAPPAAAHPTDVTQAATPAFATTGITSTVSGTMTGGT